MKTPLIWIKDFVPDLNCTDQEFMDAMTMSGTKCEGYERLDKNLENIVIGKIEKIERHPDADKLIVCQVDVGSEKVQIVTGAPNVSEGDIVPVVLSGGKVAGGHDGGPLPENGIKIKAGKLRGVESNGMMCSIEELGSSRDVYPDAAEDGIYLLPKDAGLKPGDDAIEALGMRDTVFDYEITSNRVDCYSIMGVAREAAATFNLPFHYPDVKETGNSEKASDYISVDIEDKDLCTRYIARVVKNIKIAPSPDWMKRYLMRISVVAGSSSTTQCLAPLVPVVHFPMGFTRARPRALAAATAADCSSPSNGSTRSSFFHSAACFTAATRTQGETGDVTG